MSDEQINIAIAETCGILGPWTEQITPCGCDGQWALFNSDGVRLHDYCNDLNAMHEAEKVLTDDQRWEQVKWIVDYRQAANGFPMLSRSETLKLHSATASQRAEAFLRTIGKWKEEAK